MGTGNIFQLKAFQSETNCVCPDPNPAKVDVVGVGGTEGDKGKMCKYVKCVFKLK